MPRHARHYADTLNLIGAEPEEPPYRAAPPPTGATESENEPDLSTEEEPDPVAEMLEVYDYETLDMTQAKTREGPFNGSPVMISDDETTPGVLAMWYTTRKRVGFVWKPWMAWVDPITRAEINLKPKFWRANPRMGAFW